MLQTDYAKSMECFGLERGLEIKAIEPKKGLFKTNIDEIYKQNQYFSNLIASS